MIIIYHTYKLVRDYGDQADISEDWKFVCNTKVEQVICMIWSDLDIVLNLQLEEKAMGRTCALICGHESHVTGDFIE